MTLASQNRPKLVKHNQKLSILTMWKPSNCFNSMDCDKFRYARYSSINSRSVATAAMMIGFEKSLLNGFLRSIAPRKTNPKDASISVTRVVSGDNPILFSMSKL